MDGLKRKKIIIYALVGVLVLVGLVFILGRVLGPKKPGEAAGERGIIGRIFGLPEPGGRTAGPVQTPGAEGVEQAPEDLAERKLLRLTDFPVLAPLVRNGKVVFYKKSGGALMSLDFNGTNEEKLSGITIVSMIEGHWSPKKDRAVVFYLDGENLKGFLHIGTSGVAVLPQNLLGFSWSPTGNSLVYLEADAGGTRLISADSSGKRPETIFRTPLTDVSLDWVSGNVISFNTAPSIFAPGHVFAFSQNTGVFKKIMGPLWGLESLWSPDGSLVLASYAANGGPATEILDAEGKKLFSTGFYTPAQKCVWAGVKVVYCAVPRNIPAGVPLPDAYLSGEFNSFDRLVRIDTAGQEVRDVFNEADLDMSELAVSDDEKYLFFVNRFDGSLWRIGLK